MKKFGYIGIIGRSNVGKSTLLNYILQYKVSITARKPQTTRYRTTGIKTNHNTQFVYFDTPGLYHNRSKKTINLLMNQEATGVISDVDVILFVVALNHYSDQDKWILEKIQPNRIPVILVINKVDRFKNQAAAQIFSRKINLKYQFQHVFLISAKQGHGISELEAKIAKLLPESDNFLFSEDQFSNCTERFMISEIIREKLIRTLGQELPYQLMVKIQLYHYDKIKKLLNIDAIILVERSGQKAIIIGNKGQKLKDISIKSRYDIEKFISKQIFLRLWVKVKKDWSNDISVLKSLGYHHSLKNI